VTMCRAQSDRCTSKPQVYAQPFPLTTFPLHFPMCVPSSPPLSFPFPGFGPSHKNPIISLTNPTDCQNILKEVSPSPKNALPSASHKESCAPADNYPWSLHSVLGREFLWLTPVRLSSFDSPTCSPFRVLCCHCSG